MPSWLVSVFLCQNSHNISISDWRAVESQVEGIVLVCLFGGENNSHSVLWLELFLSHSHPFLRTGYLL